MTSRKRPGRCKTCNCDEFTSSTKKANSRVFYRSETWRFTPEMEPAGGVCQRGARDLVASGMRCRPSENEGARPLHEDLHAIRGPRHLWFGPPFTTSALGVPDDPALKEFRRDFAGLMGQVCGSGEIGEEPGFSGRDEDPEARRILGTIEANPKDHYWGLDRNRYGIGGSSSHLHVVLSSWTPENYSFRPAAPARRQLTRYVPTARTGMFTLASPRARTTFQARLLRR